VNSRLATAGERGVDRMSYAAIPDRDPLSRLGWHFQSGGSYGSTTYSKTALMLLTLESVVGEQTVMRGLHEYFEQYKFKHPTPQQFTASMNKSAGRNLDWYWEQAIYGTETLDDRILVARSERKDWYSKDKEKKGATLYRSEVVVHRLGNFDLPVTLQVQFDDGSVERKEWDGKDRWHRFVWERKEKLASAEIDPDNLHLLDRNPFNNSWRAETDGRAAGKIAGYWTLLTQWLAQLLSWLA
jgi:hypothetical protein